MNYSKVYDDLIESRKNRILDDNEYYENHHIVPRSLGGSNDDKNLIKLTAREHYIAHLLLFKFNKGKYKSKMAYALYFMKSNNKFCNSKLYENMRTKFSLAVSGKNNSFYGKTFTKKAKQKISKGGEKRKKENNGMYGKNHSQKAKSAISKANKGRFTDNKNPSKRPDVRKKLSLSKLKEKNPNSKHWRIISPNGEIFEFIGGIKKFFEKHNITYIKARNPKHGWIIKELPRK